MLAQAFRAASNAIQDGFRLRVRAWDGQRWREVTTVDCVDIQFDDKTVTIDVNLAEE